MSDQLVFSFTILVFLAVAMLAAAIGSYLEMRRRVRRRLGNSLAPAPPGQVLHSSVIANTIRSRLDENLLAPEDPEKRSALRRDLTRAGFFSIDAPMIFIVIQALTTIITPVSAYFLVASLLPAAPTLTKAIMVGCLAYAGYLAPDVFLKRRQARLETTYRAVFPDFLDQMVVCVDAGLSINAALDRVSNEISSQCRPFGENLKIMLSEIRSGRAFADALESLTDRVAIQEARSFAALIKQSLQLGTDVGKGMRVFADEMRVKRLMKAEMAANTLAVKMLLPLGLFIFPVLMIVIFTPAFIRATEFLAKMNGG